MSKDKGLTPLPPGPALVRRTLIAVTLGAAACGEEDKTSATQTPMPGPTSTTEADPTVTPMFTTAPTTTAGDTTLIPPMVPPTGTDSDSGATTVIPPMRPPMPDPTTEGTTTEGTTTEGTTTEDTSTTIVPPMPPPQTTGETTEDSGTTAIPPMPPPNPSGP